MQRPRLVSPQPRQVRAVFQSSAAFFDMPRVATFEELADRLCRLGERHDGRLTRVDIDTDPLHAANAARRILVRELAGVDCGPLERAPG